jgi:hypothetical protein
MDKIDNDIFTTFDDYISDATLYFKNKKEKSIDDENNPFKEIINTTFSNCQYLSKK